MCMLLARLPIVILFIALSTPLSLIPLTTPPILQFTFLCHTIINSEANIIYTVQLDSTTNENTFNSYSLDNGQFFPSASHSIQQKSSQNWQIIITGQQIATIPIDINTNIITFNQTNLKPIQDITNTQHFLNIISSEKYNLSFLSTNNGNIYYTFKNNSFSSFVQLLDSKHVGNTFLSLSPNNLFLCSTDQFTGYVTLWSVPNLRKLYEFKTAQKGIRAHSWDKNSKIIYAFGYQSGQFYQFKIENSMRMHKQITSNLTYVTSCSYFHQSDQIIAFSYHLSAVVSYSVSGNNYKTLVGFQGAEKIVFQPTQKYFSIFNNTTASYYAISTLCAQKEYFDIQTNQCKSCGTYCLSCKPGECNNCSEGTTLSSDGFNCVKQNNSQTYREETIIYNQSSFFQQSSTYFLNTTLDFINKTFQLPAQRQFLNIFFQLFSSFDHLVLFIYHNRTYGSNMKFYLQLIHSTLDYRFNIINNEVCQKYLGIDFNQWKSNIDFKANYSLTKYVQIQNNGQGLFVNNLQYFFLNIPLTFMSICLAKFLFHLLFNYSVSLLLRKFQFFGVFIIALLEGNVQFFFFALTADFLTLFSPNFLYKLYTSATVLAGWFFICLSTFGLFSLYLLYKKYSRFLLQNTRGTLASSLYFLTTNGLINMLRGIIHRILITQPQLQAIVLMALELTQILIHLYCLKRATAVQSTFILTLFIVSNISRVIFNFSLLFQSQNTVLLLDRIHTLVIFTAVILIFLGIVHSVNELIRQVKKIVQIQIERCRAKNKIVVEQIVRSQVKICCEMPLKKNTDPMASHQIKQKIRKHVGFNLNEMTRDLNSFKTGKQFKNSDSQHFTTRLKKAKIDSGDPSKFLNIVFTNRSQKD